MKDISAEKRAEIETNFRAMSEKLDEYMPLHARKFALMRHGEVIEFYSNWEDAFKTGAKFYEDGLFSIQKVTKTPVDLGYFSYAMSSR